MLYLLLETAKPIRSKSYCEREYWAATDLLLERLHPGRGIVMDRPQDSAAHSQ